MTNIINGKPYIPMLTRAAIDRRKQWDYLAINYTHGRKSQIGSLVIAMLGRIQYPPAFMPILPTNDPVIDIGGMRITPTGACLVMFKNSAAEQWREECIYPDVQQLIDVFRGLADACKMDDAQAKAMFDCVRKFIREDNRPQNTHLFD